MFNQNSKLNSKTDELVPTKENGTRVTSVSVSEGLNEIVVTNGNLISQFSVGFLGVVATDGKIWIPVEVRPDSTSDLMTLYVDAPRGCVSLDLYDHLLAANTCSTTISQPKIIQQNTSIGLSGNHSLGGAANPILSYVHPSILFFPSSWNGSKYWMTATPWNGLGFTPSDKLEDGMLFTSEDGNTWAAVNVNATGFANLTAAFSESGVSTDSRLVYDDVTNKIYHYFRYTISGSEIVYRQETSNGTTWTNAAGTTGGKDIVKLNGSISWRYGFEQLPVITTCLSPSILKVGAEWKLWCTAYEKDGLNDIVMRYASSLDGLNFFGGDILEKWWPHDFQGVWHSDVQFDEDSRQYVLIGQLQRRSSEGTIGSTFSNINILATSEDGITNWKLSKTPVAITGQDSPETRFIYKGALVRTGTRKWRVASSFNLKSDLTNRISFFPEATIEFDRPRAATKTSGVFIEPFGRFYKDTVQLSAIGSIQVDPSWSQTTNNATSQIVAGVLKARRGTGACNVMSGVRLQSTYKLKARLKLNTLTSNVSFSREAGEQVGFGFENNSSKLKLSGLDTGVAFTPTTDWIDVIQTRSPVGVDSIHALSITATTNGTKTVTVSSSTGAVVGRAIKIIGAGVGGSDFISKIDSVTSSTVIIVADNVPTNVTNATCKVARWLLELFINTVKVRELVSSETGYTRLGFIASGSVANTDGADILYCYQLPLDINKVSI